MRAVFHHELRASFDVDDDALGDGKVAAEAVSQLRKLANQDSPFFLAVGFWKPHTPFNAPKKYWDLYQRSRIPLPHHLKPPREVPELALTSARYRGGEDSELLQEIKIKRQKQQLITG